MPSLLDKGFSKLTAHAATALVVMLFVDEIFIRLCNLNSHRLYLNAILRLGSGASIALLLVLSAAQLAACVVITFPVLYNRLGTAVPSLALGATLLLEMVVYHGFSDNELIFKAVLVEVSLSLIGLLRGDERIRADALGTPLIGSAIAAEAKLRYTCTCVHAALVCPPLCVILFLWSMIYHRYWRLTGAAFEIHRTSFCTSVALSSVLLFAAGQDRSPSQHVATRLLDGVIRAYESGYKKGFKWYYGHVPDGKKKHL